MSISAKYVHTNIIAQDWQTLTEFYMAVFGCVPVPPERNQSGAWLEQATGVDGAALQGMHLRLPGWGDDGPTLEIYQYQQSKAKLEPAANRLGLGHIAFAVDDVAAARETVLEHGGHDLGQIVTTEIPGAGTITVVYMADPEGNLIELQRWA